MKINKKRLACYIGTLAIGISIGFAVAPAEVATAETPTNTAQTAQQKILLNDDQREMIERVVMAEARGESYDGQKAVVEVIHNRCAIWGLSVEEVLLTKYQFAKPYDGEISDSVKQAVSEVFDMQNIGMSDALFFHADYVNPSWSNDMIFICQIGGHKFYAEK